MKRTYTEQNVMLKKMQKRRRKNPEVEVAMGQMVIKEDTSNGNPIGMNLHGRIVATMETEEMTGDLSSPPKPKTLGPCFQCGAYNICPYGQVLQYAKKTISFYAACGKQY